MLMRSKTTLGIAVAAVLTLSACSDTGDDAAAETTVVSATSTSAGEAAVVSTTSTSAQAAAADDGEAAAGEAPAEVAPLAISAEMPYDTRFVEVNGSNMAYVEAGDGDPILFLHGNPTSKFLWRNIMPWLEAQGRVIAPDLIGFGESDKPDIGYTMAEHSEYVDGFIEALGLENVTLVVHDWGSGLGFDYAARNPDNIKGIAFMESMIAPLHPISTEGLTPQIADALNALRGPSGETLIIDQNAFVEGNIPNGVFRDLTEGEMDVYRAPFVEPESRLPILVFPRQISVDGEPADVTERVNAFNTYLLTTDVPKLHLYVTPGLINPPEAVEFLQAQGAPNYEAVFLGQGSHFLQEDHPEAIGRNISDWYRRLGQ